MILFIKCCLSLIISPLFLGATEEPLPLVDVGQDRFFDEFMHMLTTLGLIVGVIFLISWFLKKMVNTRIQQANTDSYIKILEKRVLSPRSNLYVLEVYDKHLIVGETMNTMQILGEFDVPPENSSVSSLSQPLQRE